MTRVTLALACVALLACGDDDGGAAGVDGGRIRDASGDDAGEAGSGGTTSGGGSGGSSGSGESGSGGAGMGGVAAPTDAGDTMVQDAATADASTDAATDAGGCQNGTIEVEIDGMPHAGCVDMLHKGGLNHVIGSLDDGSGIVVNFTGTMPDMDVCVSISLRKPGNASNDWDSMTNGCETTITEYDATTGHVVGTFAATVEPAPRNDEPARELTHGAFDALMP